MPADPPDDFRTVAFWDGIIQRDPSGTLDRSDELLATSDDVIVVVLARWARSRALFDLGRQSEAQDAARIALEAIDATVTGEVRAAIVLSSAVILAESGDVASGLEVLDGFVESSDHTVLGRVELQKAYILHHAGRLVEALTHVDRAERLLGNQAQPRDLFRLYNQRGVVLLQQGRFSAAESDFSSAERIAGEAGLDVSRALTISNRAVLYGRARRLAESVRTFDAAARAFRDVGSPTRVVALSEIDRAEVMMHSGLVLDAIEAARRAVELVEPTGNRVLLGDAQLVLARAELAAGSAGAVASAEFASTVFAATGRPDMVWHANAVAVEARLRAAPTVESFTASCADATDLIDQFRSQGWHRQADHLALERVRAAGRFDRLGDVVADLDALRQGASSDQRDVALTGLLAESFARLAENELHDAMAAARAGLEQLDVLVAEASTLEERSAVIRLGADLSQAAIDIATAMGDAATVLAAAEGTRARALHYELSERERHQPLTDAGAQRLRYELAERLGPDTLVVWVVVRQRVLAVIVADGNARLVDVAAVRDVIRARDRVLAQLDLASAEPDASSARAMRAAAAFDELVVEPLRLPSDAGIVMVPVDVLHGVPWSGLPSLVQRHLTLVPNAQIWLEADRRARLTVRDVGFIVGPDVEGGDAERATIVTHYPSAAIAAGVGASGATFTAMLRGYGLVHVAAHGRFRTDRPLLSTLRLADGEVTLHDAIPERVESRVVVLSSCEGGAHGTDEGAEVLGLSAVLLARGAATVVAPLTAVRDLECAEFTADVHAAVAVGEPIAGALAAVRGRWLADDDLSRWAVASAFACFGSGATRVSV